MKLSFIIPLYNAETFICKCLDSILNSDIDRNEYEIIVIDDGSKDNGLTVVRQYEQQYDNITVLVQENQGQSVARNYGMTVARGEYLWFIDSDDYLDNHWTNVYNELIKLDVDVFAIQLKEISEAGEFIVMRCVQSMLEQNTIMSGRSAVIAGYDPSSVCALITRRQLFVDNNLQFYPGITHQDVELSYKMMSCAKKVYFSNYFPYIYVLHPGSTSKATDINRRIKYISDDVIIAKSFRKFAEGFANTDKELYEVIMRRSQNILLGLALSLFKNKREWRQLNINSAVLQKMKEEGVYPLKGSFGSFKKNLLKLVLNKEWLLK